MIEIAQNPTKLIETSSKLNPNAKIDISGLRPDGITKIES